MSDSQYLYDIFTLHYDSARKASLRGDKAAVKKHLLYAAKMLLELAQSETGVLKQARLERANRLLVMAENIETQKVNFDEGDSVAPPRGTGMNKGVSNDTQQNDAKVWQSAVIPDVKFSDVAGLESVKETIRVRMINPIKYPEKYAAYGKKTGGGVLLYGPPGTGKTMIAKAIANEVGAKFYAVKGSDIVSKWVGESEKNINSLFETARKDDRAIIFIDEMDSLFGQRGIDTHNDKRVNEFLQQIDGFVGKSPNLLLLGATNRPWDIDNAAVRSGRFSEKIYVTLPDAQAREYLFRRQLKNLPLDKEVDISSLVALTENYSGADIAEVCDLAKEEPLKKYIETDVKVDIKMADLLSAISKIKPTVDLIQLAKFEEYAGKTGRTAPKIVKQDGNASVSSKDNKAVFESYVVKIVPDEDTKLVFYLPGEYERVYLELRGKHYVCSRSINNWSCSVSVDEAGEYEVIISAKEELCRQNIKFVKGIEENDMGL